MLSLRATQKASAEWYYTQKILFRPKVPAETPEQTITAPKAEWDLGFYQFCLKNTVSSNTGEAEADRSLQVWGQPSLQRVLSQQGIHSETLSLQNKAKHLLNPKEIRFGREKVELLPWVRFLGQMTPGIELLFCKVITMALIRKSRTDTQRKGKTF